MGSPLSYGKGKENNRELLCGYAAIRNKKDTLRIYGDEKKRIQSAVSSPFVTIFPLNYSTM